MIRADLVLGLCFAASAAQGQVFNEPKYFGWLDPPETASATERLGRMIHQNVWDDNVYDPVLDQWVSRESPQHPIAVARCVAFRIMLAVHNPNQPVVVNGVERFSEPPVNPQCLAITLLNFGKDALSEQEETSTAAVRFFVPAADNLPGISDFDFPNTNAPLYERKAYRHPFLVNATEAGPMRAWGCGEGVG